MRLTRRRTAGWALTALLVMATAAWLFQREASGVDSQIASEVERPASVAAVADAATGESGPSDAPLASVPTPPGTTPLNALWAALQGPAQAGDAVAACRLAIETLRCVNTVRFAAAVADQRRVPEGELAALMAFEGSPSTFVQTERAGDSGRDAVIEAMDANTQAAVARCEGLSEVRAHAALALLRAAALAGQPDAQAAYAAGEGWFLSMPGAMGRPEFDQWRREAPLIVARMLDAGHPDAPGLLAGAYSHQTWLGGLYDPDLERASAYLILNARLMGKPHMAERELQNVPADVVARARQQAEALHAKHFAGRPTAKASYWLGVGVRLMQSRQSNAPPPCMPPAASAPARNDSVTASP